MAVISYIMEKEVNGYGGLNKVSALNSVEDVATLIETFEDVIEKVGFEKIKYVLCDDEGYYYFIISDKCEKFDLYEFINSVYKNNDFKVSCLNARSLFPRSLSRGIYEYDEDEEISTGEDDTPTGFLDEDKIPKSSVPYLRYNKNGDIVKVTEVGLIIGRSPSKVGYLIKDNGNVGRTHCRVYLLNNRIWVHDYDSKNGTFVNNRKVYSDKDIVLSEGDTLTLADEEFSVVG